MDTSFLSSFSGNNGIPLLVTIVVILAGLSILVKKGYISFNGKELRVGQDQKTRSLIQNQFEYVNAILEGCIADLPPHLDIYRTKYIIGKVEDVFQKAIIFNNMDTSSSYIRAKQELVYSAVRKRATDGFFKTKEFKKYCDDLVEHLILDLVTMKVQYK